MKTEGKHRHEKGESSHSRGRPRVCRAEAAAKEAAEAYHKGFSKEVKIEVERTESMVREQYGITSNSQVEEELIRWVPDTGFSDGRETKFLKMVEMHWHMKIFIAMTERVVQQARPAGGHDGSFGPPV